MPIYTRQEITKQDIVAALKRHMYTYGEYYDRSLEEPDGSYPDTVDVSDRVSFEHWEDCLTQAARDEIGTIADAIYEGIERAGGTITMEVGELIRAIHDRDMGDSEPLPEPLEQVAKHVGQLFSWYDPEEFTTTTSTCWHPAQKCKDDPECWVCKHMCNWTPGVRQ